MTEEQFFSCCRVAGDLYGTVLQANVRAYAVNPQSGLVMPGYDTFFTILDKVKEDMRKEVDDSGGDETEAPDGEDN